MPSSPGEMRDYEVRYVWRRNVKESSATPVKRRLTELSGYIHPVWPEEDWLNQTVMGRV